MEYNPVNWFEIYVQDMTRAKKFYESVFGTTLVKLNTPDIEMWSFPMEVDRFGAGGSLVKMEGFPSGGNSIIIYFNCNDCAVEAARVADAKGSLFKEKKSIGEYGFIALAFDTEGNMIGLHSMK
jgi:predicted enzyme related to lactoylglutathione lyase